MLNDPVNFTDPSGMELDCMKSYYRNLSRSVDFVFILSALFAILLLILYLLDYLFGIGIEFDKNDMIAAAVVISSSVVLYLLTKRWIKFVSELR